MGDITTEHKICQSCGMNIDDDGVKGTEADGDLSKEYCSFCYKDGIFTNTITLDGMVEIGLDYSPEYQGAASQEEKDSIRQQAKAYLSELKRWKK